MQIRRALETDAARIAEIYNWYVLNTIITFETTAVAADEMEQRMQEKLAHYDWIVGKSGEQIVGYAYYGAFRARAAYRQTVESTVYLSPEAVGRGFGKSLYTALVESARQHGVREMIGVIALPNPASMALHQKLDFREVGVLRGVGYKFDRYVDVGLWQRSLGGTTHV